MQLSSIEVEAPSGSLYTDADRYLRKIGVDIDHAGKPAPKPCPFCGAMKDADWFFTHWRFAFCDCEVQNWIRENEARMAKTLKDVLLAIGFGELYANCTFKSYDCQGERQSVLVAALEQWCDQAVAAIDKVKWLMFFGPHGTGKTHLAASICGRIGTRIGCKYAAFKDMVGRITTARMESKRETQAAYTGCQLLILDEMPLGELKPNEYDILSTVIGARYNNNKPCILIQNGNSETLYQMLRGAMTDRVRERGQPINFNWGSHRKPYEENREYDQKNWGNA